MRALLLLALTVVAAAAEPAKTGFFTLTFEERCPSSAHEVLAKRYSWNKPEARDLYEIGKEEFEVHVPPAYDGSVAYGLIVYTNSGKGGNARQYAELMARHRLIWIGATDVPNERSVAVRFGLALDAAWNMPRRYRIDARRVYACGNSGGGRCSSMIAPAWPELFSGGIYLVGCNNPTLPPDKALAARALAGRYALVTGSDDFNRPGTLGVLEAYKGLGVKQVQYFEQPGLGHANPSAEWFEKALTFCDKPLVDEAAALLAQGQALEAKKAYEAAVLYRRVASEFPVAQGSASTARTRFEALVPALDAQLRAEMAKLGAGSKERWRQLAERTAGFPCADEARANADTFGAKELEAAQAAGGSGLAGKLRKLRDDWQGFPTGDKAGAAYEELADKALEPLLELDKAKGRNAKLAAFLKAWPGSKAALQAQAALEQKEPK
ncbi:MAG: hypothetical protein L6R48_15335 [Planctomycetes bacterium]|nr:hypothetical protein [Planctomycetota bacterium]